jgi:hypothetical protein
VFPPVPLSVTLVATRTPVRRLNRRSWIQRSRAARLIGSWTGRVATFKNTGIGHVRSNDQRRGPREHQAASVSRLRHGPLRHATTNGINAACRSVPAEYRASGTPHRLEIKRAREAMVCEPPPGWTVRSSSAVSGLVYIATAKNACVQAAWSWVAVRVGRECSVARGASSTVPASAHER